MKRHANRTLLLCAAVLVALIACWLYVPSLPNTLEKRWIYGHVENHRNDASDTIGYAISGDPDHLAAKLQTERWQSVRRGDRAWPAKRKMLGVLIRSLEATAGFDDMLRWAGYWRNLDERDVDAAAYWFESLRHTRGREKEGLDGLARELNRFPANAELIRLNARALEEKGDVDAARELRRKLLKQTEENWALEWHRRNRDVLSWYGKRIKTHLGTLDIGDAWSTTTELLNLIVDSKKRRRLKRHGGTHHFRVAPNDANCCEIKFELPTAISTLYLSPPAANEISISDLVIRIGDREFVISPDNIHTRYMYRSGKWFRSIGDDESLIRFSVVEALESLTTEQVSAVLRFKVRAKLMPMPGDDR